MNIDIHEHYDKIYRYCYFRLKNQYLAEDITQETFLRFLECGSYKETGRPLAYLYTVARNLCIDEFRKTKAEELASDIVQDGFEDALVEKEDLHKAITALSIEEQELLLLRYVNDVSFIDLCRMYSKSRFAIYRELKKITNKLGRRISDGE